MSSSLPSSSLKTDDLRLDKATALTIGFGLHNAWVLTTMYSTHTVFGISTTLIPGIRGGGFSFLFLASIAAFCIIMFAAAWFDQKLASVSRSRSIMAIGAIATCIGTVLAIFSLSNPVFALVFELCSGVITGFGSAVLMLYWGIAFAREKPSTIAIAGSIAVALGFAFSTLFLQAIPFPAGGVVVAAIPLLEFLILRAITPQPTKEKPRYFNALPTSKPRLGLSLMGPLVLVGFALGILKQASVQTTLEGVITPISLIILLLAGSLTISLFTFFSLTQQKISWDQFLRVVVPAIACAALFVSLLVAESPAFSDLFLLIAYIFIETLVWVNYTYLSHRVHLSPIFLIGLSRGIITLSMLAGALIVAYANPWIMQSSLSDEGLVIVPLVLIALGFALMPREIDMTQRIVECPAVRLVTLELEGKLGLLEPHQASVTTSSASSIVSDPAALTTSASPTASASPAPSYAPPTTDAHALEQQEQLQGSQPLPFTNNHPLHSELERDIFSPSSSKDSSPTALQEGRFTRKVKKVAVTFLLTERETDILFELAKGNSPSYIQEKYYISTGTVKTHIRNIYRKLDVHKRNDLLRLIEEIEDFD